MIPFDQFNGKILENTCAEKYLSGALLAEFSEMAMEARKECLDRMLTQPVCEFTAVNELYFRYKWSELFHSVLGGRNFSLLEVASGDADMIPQAMACDHSGSTYIAANLNVALNQSLISKTNGLPINFRLIDDDAAKISSYLPAHSVDIIAFQHGVNDVLQGILCGRRGIDLVNSDWMEMLPEMIRILQEEIREGTLEEHVREPFLSLLEQLAPVLKEEGMIAVSHYMFQLDLDLGYPADLFENLVPLLRKWLREDGRWQERTVTGYDQQWWIFLNRIS